MILILFTNILNTPLAFMQGLVLDGFDIVTSIGGFLPRIW